MNAYETHQSTAMGVSPGTGMSSEQPEQGRYQAPARRGWGYQINKIVIIINNNINTLFNVKKRRKGN